SIPIRLQRIEYIAAMTRSDIEDPNGNPLRPQAINDTAQRVLDVLLPNADPAPADRVEIASINEPTERRDSGGLVLVDVIETAAGVEAGDQAETDSIRK